MLRWHDLWASIGLEKGDQDKFLGTDWDWVLAIIFLVITIRVVLFPLYVKQIKSQRAMQALQPRIKELQTKYKGGDKQAMQQELMELYRKEKANPIMGCLPLALQAPVLLALFHVLRHLSHPDTTHHEKTLYGWSAQLFDSASHAHLFGAPIAAGFRTTGSLLTELNASAINVKIVAGLLVAIMIATTFMTQRQMIARTGWATDPQQKMIQRLMLYGVPVMLLISGGIFPIGVVIYWVTSNLFSLGQQSWILHKYPPPPNAAKAAEAAGKPLKGKAAEEARKAAQDRADAARALAPKPGAKPVKKRTPGTGPNSSATGTVTSGSTAPGSTGTSANGAAKPGAKKAAAAKRTGTSTGTRTSSNGSKQVSGTAGAANKATKRKAGP
ncbi:MAG: membrane protein insertase YidC [Actinocatenispora sp.]